MSLNQPIREPEPSLRRYESHSTEFIETRDSTRVEFYERAAARNDLALHGGTYSFSEPVIKDSFLVAGDRESYYSKFFRECDAK